MNKQQLAKKIWESANKMRSKIEASEYKDYILGFIFYKFLSDREEDFLLKNDFAEEDIKSVNEEDAEIVEFVQSGLGYFISYENLFSTWINEGHDFDIANVRDALSAFSRLIGTNYKRVFDGIFQTLETGLSNLGSTAKEQSKAVRDLLYLIKDIPMDDKQDYDVLGFIYEYLISNFAANAGKKAGEFFTPAEVSTLLAKLTKSKPGARICDPTCGSGSLLIKAGKEVGNSNFSLYGQEVNGSTWALAMMNMFLHGFDNAVIRWGDTLRNPKLKENDQLMKFDTVVANPPFSLDKWGADEAASDPYNRFWRGIPPKSKGDWAFISHMIEVAQEGSGKVGVVIPHGVLFRGASEGKIRKHVIDENLLEAVIGLPANLFFGTGIPAAIAIFNKGKHTDNVLFIDASREYEDGKNQNKLRPEDIDHIVSVYHQFVSGQFKPGVVEDKYAFVATPADIQENDYNLNIPRYVDTFEEEAEVDIPAVQKEIDALEAELAEVQAKMKGYLKELGY